MVRLLVAACVHEKSTTEYGMYKENVAQVLLLLTNDSEFSVPTNQQVATNDAS